MAARHLYVHLPFCSSRCGYCDFVTVVGRNDEHDAYVEALRTELDLERRSLDARPETVYLGGGTPTFTRPASLERLLAALPACDELTVEANPETVTSGLASLLRRCGVDRVSLGAQSFQPQLLETLGRAARPDDVRRAFGLLREAGFTNISLDLIYGIPGQAPAISHATSTRRSSSPPSTSPRTSSRRSPGRDSRTPTAPSSSVRQSAWSRTSRPWSRR